MIMSASYWRLFATLKRALSHNRGSVLLGEPHSFEIDWLSLRSTRQADQVAQASGIVGCVDVARTACEIAIMMSAILPPGDLLGWLQINQPSWCRYCALCIQISE